MSDLVKPRNHNTKKITEIDAVELHALNRHLFFVARAQNMDTNKQQAPAPCETQMTWTRVQHKLALHNSPKALDTNAALAVKAGISGLSLSLLRM